MAQQRPSAAKALHPNLPSIEDPQRFVRGQVGNPATRSWLDALNEARRKPEPPSWGQGMWFPKSSPRAMKKS
jgi:hypothetical protein